MSDLSLQRCFNHAEREAVARCPECREHFCRECITEHDDRVICASCLRKLAHRRLIDRAGFSALVRALELAGGLLLAWFFFYWIGDALASLPDKFHETTLWKADWLSSDETR